MTNKLTDKVTLRHGATLNNRIAMSPMQSQSGKRNGFVSDDTLKYYGARSQVGGLIVTEFHYVSENGGPAYLFYKFIMLVERLLDKPFQDKMLLHLQLSTLISCLTQFAH